MSSISMSSLPSPSPSPPSPTRTRRRSTICSSTPAPRPCAPSAADPQHLGAEIGFITILHTWGQNLLHHPHVHCIVPGGGLAPDGHWRACRAGFFLPVRVLSRLYRRLFLQRLQTSFDTGALNFFGDIAAIADPAAFAAQDR